ncbi:MAG: peptidoglycan DD-metalloendopeptidase family protein [Gemmatimonadales bacterium]
MRSALCAVVLIAGPLGAQAIPPLPDTAGWGVHALAIARAPDGAVWVGTYGQGIFVLRRGAESWERIRASDDSAAHSISWDFVHAFGFGPRGQVWYGTVGNGWGLSTDGGKTWRNWGFNELGPEWQYVTPDGILTRGDTTYIATADGVKLTWDDGQTWRVVTDSFGLATARDSVWGTIRSQYILALGADEGLWIRHGRGTEVSRDGGRHWIWTRASGRDAAAPRLPPRRFPTPAGEIPAAERPGRPRHTWFRRPIALTDQPYIDQTYRFGATMGGNFQPHQGVEFNNGNGTPVHAIGDGVVVHAGPAERGALTVAIKHGRRLTADGRPLYLFSVYYHNSKLLITAGQRVTAGDVIAQVGNTGRATNDHLHLEVHASPFDSTRLIVDPAVRYPPHNVNPELWIAPLPGTGIVAGHVWDSAGQPVRQARIYGLVKPEPRETPFSFIETYGPRNHFDPVYREHFAISDVPPGEYVLGVDIGGQRVFRRVNVEPGALTWVEFRP